jgi:hypothetical protein
MIQYSKPGFTTQHWWSVPDMIMKGNNGVDLDDDDNTRSCSLRKATVQKGDRVKQ